MKQLVLFIFLLFAANAYSNSMLIDSETNFSSIKIEVQNDVYTFEVCEPKRVEGAIVLGCQKLGQNKNYPIVTMERVKEKTFIGKLSIGAAIPVAIVAGAYIGGVVSCKVHGGGGACIPLDGVLLGGILAPVAVSKIPGMSWGHFSRMGQMVKMKKKEISVSPKKYLKYKKSLQKLVEILDEEMNQND